jgi:DNA polymerase-3 subunit delta'
LPEEDVRIALAAVAERAEDDPELTQAAAGADGSIARAVALLEGEGLALRQQVIDALARLPNTDARALHALAEKLAGTDPQLLAAFMDLVNGWLSQRVGRGEREAAALARVAESWKRINANARDVEAYNLDRKPFVFSVFDELSALRMP